MLKKVIEYFKEKFPRTLIIYYKIRFIFRAFYKKEPRAHLFWNLQKGDSKFHKRYDLNSNSIIFDVGGFDGEFTDKILLEFDCSSFIFEPHPFYYQKLKDKYKSNNNVKVFNYGLGGSTESLYLTDNGAGSEVTKEQTDIKILIKDITEVIKDFDIEKIDLLKLNIEGSEYDLLEKLLKSRLISTINKIQIQFHENINDADLRRDRIRRDLNTTHKEVWSYYMVWERWDKK